MKNRQRNLLSIIALLTASATTSVFAATYKGQGTGLEAKLNLLDISQGFARGDTEYQEGTSGFQIVVSDYEASENDIYSAVIFQATTFGYQNGDGSKQVDSTALITNAEAAVSNSTDVPVDDTSTADSILLSSATAVCKNGGVSLAGDATILDLSINGMDVTPDDTGNVAPNTTVEVPIDLLNKIKITLNEQVYTPPNFASGDSSGVFTVSAAHIEVQVLPLLGDTYLTTDEIYLARSIAGFDCSGSNKPPKHCPPTDFYTGGGKLDTANVTFAVHGGIKPNGEQFGGLNLVDHDDNTHIKSNSLVNYAVTDTATRILTFAMDDRSTCTVTVTDNGEPGGRKAGGSDEFGISCTTSYSINSMVIDGGNLQHHTAKCSDTGATGGGGNNSGGDSGSFCETHPKHPHC